MLRSIAPTLLALLLVACGGGAALSPAKAPESAPAPGSAPSTAEAGASPAPKSPLSELPPGISPAARDCPALTPAAKVACAPSGDFTAGLASALSSSGVEQD